MRTLEEIKQAIRQLAAIERKALQSGCTIAKGTAPSKAQHHLQCALHRSPSHSVTIAREHFALGNQLEFRGVGGIRSPRTTRSRVHRRLSKTSDMQSRTASPDAKPNGAHRLFSAPAIRPSDAANRNGNVSARNSKRSRRHLTYGPLTNSPVLVDRSRRDTKVADLRHL